MPPTKSPNSRPLTAAQIPGALKRFAAPTGTDRYNAGKSLILTAEESPATVYPYFDTLVPILSSDSNIIRWNAQRILAALAPVDTDHKLDTVLGTLIAFIAGTNMISASNSIAALGRIAQVRPDLLRRIVAAILEVETATYATPECRNVAIGHALDTFKGLWPAIAHNPAVRAFVERQLTNSRVSAAKRAQTLLALKVGVQTP